jgi:hypothetical protein
MALIYCPECGHEISNSAVACPNCGRPLQAGPVAEERIVVNKVHRDRSGFPPWAFVPLGLLGAALLFFLFMLVGRNNDEAANSSINVNVATRRSSAANRDTATSIEPQPISPGPQAIEPPPVTETQSVTVPGSQTSVTAPPDRGTVRIDAKVATDRGTPQAVRNEKFYLLDKDVEMILSDAGLEPIAGQSLANSLGLSILYPDRYGDFHRDALKAINSHVKYSGTTDGNGVAQLKDVKPDAYYLFGITRKGSGFAIWSSPVSIIAGENALNLSPQRITEIQDNAG